ncbi:MAG: MarR family transcriptional regulator [Bacteroidales bacterium]
MKTQGSPEIMTVARMLFVMSRALKKRIIEHADIMITKEQVGLLLALSLQSEEVIQNDMADVMGKDKSAILRFVDSLEEKELVRRTVDQKDRRKNYLTITEKGERVIELCLETMHDFMEELEQGLTRTEIDTFYKVVAHFKTNAENL